MKQIDDIYDVYMNASIGPVQNLRRFMAHQDYLNQRGYNLNLYMRDFSVNGSEGGAPIDFSKGLGFRSWLKHLFKKSRIASVLWAKREQRMAEKLVKAYLELNRDPDVVVFRSYNEIRYYLQHRRSNRAKVVLFHEDDGIRLKMQFESYPKLAGTRWEKKNRAEYESIDQIVDRNVFIAYKSKKNFIEENPSIPQERLVAFHNGIDNIPYKKGVRQSGFKYNLCISGTVCPRKGQYIIVDALIKSPQEVRDKIHVTIIGQGGDFETLKTRVSENGLERNVAFLGNVENKKVHSILCGCDIYILMSNSEGLPISIIEGLRAGLGVISTPVAGIPEMVKENNGILINPDSNELANVFAHIDGYDWKTFGKNSRKLFEEEFDFSQMISSYCDMMDGLFENA